MLRQSIGDSGKDWPQWISFLLFVIREAPQASTVFSPFELLYGQYLRGILDVLHEEWGMPPKLGVPRTLPDGPPSQAAWPNWPMEELAWDQEDQRLQYNSQAWPYSFKVLLLLPSSSNKLLMGWEDPYKVLERVVDINYQIQVPGQGKHLYHINLLKDGKGWPEREDPSLYNVEIDWDEESQECSQELHAQVTSGEPTSAWRQHQIQQVLSEFQDIFCRHPQVGKRGKTSYPHPHPAGKVVHVPLRPTP